MKWFMAIAAVLAVPALAFGSASFTLSSGGASGVTIDPGGSFTLDLGMTFAAPTTGLQGFDVALTVAEGDDILKMVSPRTVNLNAFSPTVGDFGLFNINKNLKTVALSGQNLGGTYQYGKYGYTWDASAVASSMSIGIADVAGTPGVTYTLSIGSPGEAGLVILDQNKANVYAGPAPTFAVTITPEPASMLLLVGALPFLRRRRS